MSPSVIVVNSQVNHINTIQVLVAMLKFRKLCSPPGKYFTNVTIFADFILFFPPPGTSWILPWTTQNTF